MEFIDYYKVLGVEPNADDKTIKATYRKLARKYHPDVNKDTGAEDKFKEIAEAYEVLKTPEKRAEFDQLRQYAQQGGNWQSHARQGSGNQAGAGNFHFETDGNMGGFSDFFESIFGGRSGSSRAGSGNAGFSFKRKGQDTEMVLPVFLEEVVSGQPKSISYKVPSYDSNGQRQPDITKTLNIKIPRGVTSGERIRLKGQGASGIGGSENGDLYLTIEFAPHPEFDIKEHDLTLALPIAPWEAALGAKVKASTLTGTININVPENSQSGQKFRIKGKGLPKKKEGEAGDLYIVLKIVMPATLNDESKALWKQLAEKNPFDPRARRG